MAQHSRRTAGSVTVGQVWDKALWGRVPSLAAVIDRAGACTTGHAVPAGMVWRRCSPQFAERHLEDCFEEQRVVAEAERIVRTSATVGNTRT